MAYGYARQLWVGATHPKIARIALSPLGGRALVCPTSLARIVGPECLGNNTQTKDVCTLRLRVDFFQTQED